MAVPVPFLVVSDWVPSDLLLSFRRTPQYPRTSCVPLLRTTLLVG